jgi:hydrogenase maturation factor
MKKLAIFLLLFAVVACATHNQAPTEPGAKIVITGKITDEGVECLAMRSDDGTLYTLGRPQNPPASGQRVRVTGTIAGASFCMQGTTINVETIEVL